MRISIEENERKFSIILPTRIVLSKPVLKLILRSNKEKDISAKAVCAVCAELRRFKKKYGSWQFVDFQSADGLKVTVTV